MVSFESVFFRLFSCAWLVVLFYWVAGWDLQEPCSVYFLTVLLLLVQNWVIDKKKALQLGRANRANKDNNNNVA